VTDHNTNLSTSANRDICKKVAVTGYSYRLPGGLNCDDDFWRLLSAREIVQVPIVERYGPGNRPIGKQSSASRFASAYEGLLTDDAELMFDPRLFNISQPEFLNLNPQLRMLLHCAWEAFEYAGWSMNQLRNSATGVFIGSQTPSVANWRSMVGENEYSVLSPSLSMLANQVSYHFNLMGPSITYCTACSAALSALHSAINAFRCGDCEQALVGSATYLGSANQSRAFAQLGVLSPEGKCNSFDANANGYMRSEGCFAFAIKPLQNAIRDGDHIFAVIEATAVNTAGAADDAAGMTQGRYITAPTRHSQIELMKEAMSRAGRTAAEFHYLEAHATGTVVGDRIEGNAIAETFRGRAPDNPLKIASVKSNIGHLEAAAFHASLLKIILMIKHRTFAPISKNFLVPNPEIDFATCPMQVQTHAEPFPEHPAVFGINSFGFGGANGHCVVSEYDLNNNQMWSSPLTPDAGYMIPVSARSADALAQSVENLREYLEGNAVDMYTLAGNLSLRRSHFAARTSFAADDQQSLLEKLRKFEQTQQPVCSASHESSGLHIAMLFAGQGTQWAKCGVELYRTSPVFRRVVDAIEQHWTELADFSLKDACFFENQDNLNQARLAQPVIFMVECALFELFKSWGVHPDIVVGHSSGEAVAAYAAGLLSLSDATRLIYLRAQLQQRTAGSGRMLAVAIDKDRMIQLLDELAISHQFNDREPKLEFACFNSPVSLVICGQQRYLDVVIESLKRQNIQHQLLAGNIAFHSSVMNQIRDDLLSGLAFLDTRNTPGTVPFISSVTGLPTDRLDSAYWWSNVREPVNFAAALETIKTDHPVDVILEISPHRALQPMVAQNFDDTQAAPIAVSTLLRNEDERYCINEALGALYRAGVTLDFESQYPRPRPMTHVLPGHPTKPQTLIERTIDDEFFIQNGPLSKGPLIGRQVFCDHLRFEAFFAEKNFPFLNDHRVQNSAIMPAAGYLEMILEAMQGKPVFFETIEFLRPCPLPQTPVRLQTSLSQQIDSTQEYSFTICSQPIDSTSEAQVHCRGAVRLLRDEAKLDVPNRLADIETDRFTAVFDDSAADFYTRMEATLGDKFHYGPEFRTLRNLQINPTTRDFIFDVDIAEDLWNTCHDEGYVLYPPVIDGALQVFLLNLMYATDLFTLPKKVNGITFIKRPSSPHITVNITKPTDDWYVMDNLGQLTVRHGDKSGGSLRFYDRSTGELFLHIEDYIYFTSNPKWFNAPSSRHMIAWQPKHMLPFSAAESPSLPETGDLTDFIIQLTNQSCKSQQPKVLHIAEFSGQRAPDKTMLQRCADRLSSDKLQIEYWLVANSPDETKANYDAFHHYDVTIRFATVDLSRASEADLESGLLRNCANDLLILHADEFESNPETWSFWRRLAVAGGLAIVSDNESGAATPPQAGWTVVDQGNFFSILQAPQSLIEIPDYQKRCESRLIVSDSSQLAAHWEQLIGGDCLTAHWRLGSDNDLQLGAIQQVARSVQAIDCFVGNDLDDPTGEQACIRLVDFVQTLIASREEHARNPCRVTILTENAVMDVENLGCCAVWGLLRSAAIELGTESGIELRLIDFGARSDLDTVAWLARNDVRERELAVRNSQLWAPRIVQFSERYPYLTGISSSPYRLSVEHPGQVIGLIMKTFDLPPANDGNIQVDIHTAALNFRDVMVALDMLPPLAYERSMLGHAVGMEASGVVQQAGAGVQQFAPGDEVIVTSGGCIANRITVHEKSAFLKPANLSMDEAASVLSVYVTAYYSLVHLARLRRGQRILIHSAMGGVGQAALELAKHLGAEIFVTAGSESKRSALERMGVRAVFDSRSFEWYDELMQQTTGEGVEAVLNSLAGNHVALGLQALKAGGWHLEIGKVDIYADNALRLGKFRKNIRFAAIDIDRLMCDDPDLIRDISESCLELLAAGSIRPIPTTAYSYKDYAKALRFMTSGEHQGKLVLNAPAPGDALDQLTIADQRPFLHPDATYFITGAFGGFGLKLLPYLVKNGARHLTLMDRDLCAVRGADWVMENSNMAYFGLDVEIDIVAGDVSNHCDVKRCISNLKRPLKGVFHLAGVLDDQLLKDLPAESIRCVFSPKAQGALNLHNATADMELDHFVLFSSIASVFGNLGQTNYSAASAFLDGLAAYRRHRGLPALSFNMAGVAESGMVARDLHVLKMIRATGIPPVSSKCAIENLDYAMRTMRDYDHVVTAIFERPAWTVESLNHLRNGRCITNQDGFQSSSTEGLTLQSVIAQISTKVAELCGHDEGNEDDPLSSFGLTSLSVAELGAFIQTQFQYQESALNLMTTSSCRSIAEAILKKRSNSQIATADPELPQIQTPVRIKPRKEIRHRRSEFAPSYEEHFESIAK